MRCLAATLAVVALVTAATACDRGSLRRRPTDRDEIRSAHGAHIRAGVSCLECHAKAVTLEAVVGGPASDGARPLLPREAQCKACHQTRPEELECAYCHTRPDRPGSYPSLEAELIFEHATHIARAKGLCIRCHAGGQESAAAFHPRRSPPMSDCTSACHQEVENHEAHEGDMRGMECARCHRDLHRYGISQLALVRHRPGFTQTHGAAARVDHELCAQCHDATHCSDCHTASPGLPPEVLDPVRVARDFVHRGDFLVRHGTEARIAQGTCTRCHGIGFCDGCHRESGIGGSVAPGSPHEVGWLEPLSPRGHARAARRDILSCSACHESNAETICASCHRVGGIAATSPHPPRFGAGLDPQRHGVCRACHADGAGP
jgi:hypothetical protein